VIRSLFSSWARAARRPARSAGLRALVQPARNRRKPGYSAFCTDAACARRSPAKPRSSRPASRLQKKAPAQAQGREKFPTGPSMVDLRGRSSAAFRCGDVPGLIGKAWLVALTRDALQGHRGSAGRIHRDPAWKELCPLPASSSVSGQAWMTVHGAPTGGEPRHVSWPDPRLHAPDGAKPAQRGVDCRP
jgi:hypothetical protein